MHLILFLSLRNPGGGSRHFIWLQNSDLAFYADFHPYFAVFWSFYSFLLHYCNLDLRCSFANLLFHGFTTVTYNLSLIWEKSRSNAPIFEIIFVSLQPDPLFCPYFDWFFTRFGVKSYFERRFTRQPQCFLLNSTLFNLGISFSHFMKL